MKQKLFALAVAAAVGLGASAYATADVKINVGGEELVCEPGAVIRNDRVLVPMRAIFEKLGAQVYWDEETEVISVIKNDFIMLLQKDNPKMFIHSGNEEKEIELSAPPTIVDDRAMVPIRAVSEAFGIEVGWNDALREVDINI